MVIVRESPRAKHSPDKNRSNWPPKSPYEALVSSPSGKRRWQDRQDLRQRTPSPSPRKLTLQHGKSPQDVLNQLGDPFESDQEDEDEETLKLKLEAIEAKLKLKKLKQAKEKHAANNGFQDPVSVLGSPRRKKPRLDEDVQVPVSPDRTRTAVALPKSPAKVLLGIDKGLRADQVSLKRARPVSTSGSAQQKPLLRVKSFTERLAESRDTEIQRQEKEKRIQDARGRSFGLATATSSNSKTAPTQSTSTGSSQQSSSTARKTKSRKPMTAEDALTYEPFSGIHVSKRKLPSADLTTALSGKELYPLPRLLKEVKSPVYEPPDCESDYVVFGIIASKSQPLDIKSGPSVRSSSPNSLSTEKKFLVLKLTDLSWEVDLFLFSTAFTKYWKLPAGTLIAILNPAIMPPRPHAKDNGRFSLKLTSSDDQILELGTARDLAFCTSLKKDGQLCNAWIDKRKTEHCDFHMNLVIDKARSARMDMNSIFRYSGQKKRQHDGSHSPPRGGPNSRSRVPRNDSSEGKGKYSSHQRRDWETGETYFMGPATTKLLDNEDVMAPEKLRRRLAAKEHERELGEKLGRLGKGLGAAYLRANTAGASKGFPLSGGSVVVDGAGHASASSSSSSSSAARGSGEGGEGERGRGRSPVKPALDHRDLPPEHDPDWELTIGTEVKPDAASLGLVRKAADVRLSPVRGRKRAPHEQAEALGWSSAFKRGVLEGNQIGEKKRSPVREKGQMRLSSPVKRARFALAKGIREPGRESLGDAIGLEDDSDDGLDII
ncbi:hypothetical protein KVT40_005386 [Elsinoe batatas]|uniref:Zinc finger Mcm10/DnaG-type domain-containing protein n=1 Tax=Elsinoe batatas TaxID=2601811 RepID=A0A8K0KYE2_9PEZI|nr:hypothetical protein KVT40_005386 [Elsinoe batatas]